MSEDPIMAALANVEEGAGESEKSDPKSAEPVSAVPGEEPDARPEGPMPEQDEPGEPEDSGFSVLSWAKSVPEGSHRDFDTSDWWDPENGAENRLAFHLSKVAPGEGSGYPNGVGVLVSFGELYWREVLGRGGGGDDGGGDDVEQDAPDAETVSRDTAEGLV